MRDPECKCWGCPTAVMLLLRHKNALGSRILDGVRSLLGYPRPLSGVLWVASKKADYAAVGINDRVGGPACI